MNKPKLQHIKQIVDYTKGLTAGLHVFQRMKTNQCNTLQINKGQKFMHISIDVENT